MKIHCDGNDCKNAAALIPVMSIEGGKEETDMRRGEGVYDKLISNMDSLNEKHLLFGVSVTVTTENVEEIITAEFFDSLADRGCKLVVFVEFVPVTEESRELAPGEEERELLKNGIGSEKDRPDKVHIPSVHSAGQIVISPVIVRTILRAGNGFLRIGKRKCIFS